jgi:hypothetical protein
MRDANLRRNQRTKSKLMAGAAGLTAMAASSAAMAADTATAAPVDPPKWVPYAQVGGGVGSGMTAGKVDLFSPVWQDLDSLLFVRLGVGTQTQDRLNFNLGAGYRTKIDPEWILGGYVGFDSSQVGNSHSFTQVSLGAELMSADWDVRLNAYDANHGESAIHGKETLYIHDTSIAILQAQYAAYSGFDGEVGYRVFGSGSTDVRLFAGGYDFSRADTTDGGIAGHNFDFVHKDIVGERGRVEVNVFDLDAIGPQSRLSVDGEVAHDSVRGTTGYVGATLRIPLDDASGGGAQALDDLDRRMADPVRRQDNVLTQWSFDKPEPVIIYNGTITSSPTNTLYYVDNTLGHGSYANPTTLKDATDRGPVNQFVVLTDRQGPVSSTGVVVQSGESVVGPGTFEVRGVNSGAVFTHDFAPGSGPVTVTSANPNAITVDSNTNLFGFTIDGPFTNAIYGHNVTGVVIGDVTITGPGTDGIKIVQDTTGTSNITIDDASISGVTNDGVELDATNATGGTQTVNLNVSGSTIDAGNDGVAVTSTTSGGSTSNLYAGIHGSTISGGSNDVIMSGTVFAGSTLNQTLVVDPTILNGGDFGVYVDGFANGGTLNQTVNISDVTVNDATDTGIFIEALGSNGATVDQNVTMTGVTVHNTFNSYGIVLKAYAESGSTVAQYATLSDIHVDGGYRGIQIEAYAYGAGTTIHQTFSITNATVTGAYYDNIDIGAYAGYGSTIHQYGTLTNVTATDSQYGNGLTVTGSAYDSATVIQRLDIDDLTATGNYYNGVGLYASANNHFAGHSATASQYVTITDSNISDNGEYGVNADVTGFRDSTARQDISITYSALNLNARGVSAYAGSYDLGSAEQNLYFAADTIEDNTGDGVYINAFAGGQSFTKQTIEFGYLTGQYTYIRGNGGDGIAIGATAATGANVYQSVLIYDVDASLNHGNGLTVSANANGYGFGPAYIYYSHVSQNVIAAFDTFDSNHGHGVALTNFAYYGGVLNQLFELYGVDASHNTGAGFYEKSTEISVRGNSFAFTTNPTSDVYLINSTFDHNGADGIDMVSFANGAVYAPAFFGGYSYMIQHTQVSGSHADYNTGAGLVLNANQRGRYSLNAQYLTISGSTFDHNTADGANIRSISYYGPGGFGDTFEQITISASAFSHNGADGLYLGALSSGRQGRAEQHVTVTGSTFDYNAGDGVHIYASATNGTYIATHPCTTVQGLTGGCAFVRQNVTIVGSDISHNTGDGVSVVTYANNYGAIYGVSGRPHAATLELYGDTVNSNGVRGLNVSNHVSGNSYLYQYIASIDTHFDHNSADGIYAASYVGGASTMLQRVLLYSYHTGASASYDGGNGFKATIEALGGSYARDVNIVQGADLSNDGSFGVDGAVAYADGTSTGLQINAVYFNTIDHNGDGVGLYSIGAGAQQISYVGGNEIAHNAFVGVYGEANFGAFQYIGVYTFGNSVHDNGTNYLFNSFGGSTQILN